MRNIIVTLYKLAELSDAAKGKAREWYRSVIASDTFWSEYTINQDAPEVLGMLGYGDVSISYSGFSSQGDGASFTANWSASECKLPAVVKAYAPNDLELHSIAEKLAVLAANHPGMSVELVRDRHSRYSHEMTVGYDFTFGLDFDDGVSTVLSDAEEEFKKLSRRLMQWIYKALERDYDHANSIESIDEGIEANGHEFDINGNVRS